MTSSSILTGNNATDGFNPQIEHHNRTFPLTPEELAEYLPRPSLAEQFKEMQERLLALEASNRELEEMLCAKNDTMWSVVMIPDEEPSHRPSKEPVEQEPQIKKSRRHAKD